MNQHIRKYIYGIDVGGTSVKVGLFDVAGTLLEKWEVKTNKSDHGSKILSDVHQSIVTHKVGIEEVIGYGFGVPGPVVDNIVTQCVNLGWKDYDIKAIFGPLVNNENIHVNNDANVAALGELFKGSAEGMKDAVMITLGTGVGGGVISNGNPVEGAFGTGGEIGHMVVNHGNGRRCNCGSMGCLETICSATGIKKEFKQLAEELNIPSVIDKDKYISAKAVFLAAKNGDELSIKTISNVAFYLGYACHILSVTTNPEVIIIGGGVSRAGNFLLDQIEYEFRKYKFIPVDGTKLTLATLGNDAGMYGAASMIIND